MTKVTRVRQILETPTKKQKSKATPPDEILEQGTAKAPNPQFKLEILDGNLGEAVSVLKKEIGLLIKRGKYHKVRIKRHGKAVLPDIPIGGFAAIEAATFLKAGPFRALLANALGRAFFEVELINEAEEKYKEGLNHFLGGDLDDAESCFRSALEIDETFAKAHLHLGVLRKMQGKREEAISHFQRVIALGPNHDLGTKAQEHLDRLK